MKTPFFSRSLSTYAVLLAVVFIATLRLSHIDNKETSWDVLGYYLPLPATFIYDDPMMDNPAWIEKVNNEKQLTGTLYQISTTPDNKPMYFFLFGMSIFFLPFFLMGHGWAAATGAPMDGFSMPYQYALVFGGIVYTIIGLLILRKILLHFYTERIAAITIIILVFATNYSHHLSYKNLETVNILFMLMCWLIWSTICWHEHYRFSQLVQIGCAVTLMALVKPSEILAILIPVLWTVNSYGSLKSKFALMWNYKKQIAGTVVICLLILSPQMYYWYIKTGSILYDSYKNPGVGLDLLSPHILDVLFSFRKGWLVYTPVMVLGLAGLILLFRTQKHISWSLGIYFLVSFYIICSWSEWWYGAAFSCRPVITAYPILAIGIGAVLTTIHTRIGQIGIGIFVSICSALYLFQWWQLMEGIYDPYRTTKAYYWAIFLQTKAPENGEELKSIFRSFEATQEWTDESRYKLVRQFHLIKGKSVLQSEEFGSVTLLKQYNELSSQDHLWIDVEVTYETPDSVFSNGPFLTTTMLHKKEAYGYRGVPLTEITDTVDGQLVAHYRYLTPEIRTSKDEFTSYIWNPGKYHLKLNSFIVRMYGRKY